MNLVKLFWRKYKYFPYEKKLGIKEVDSLLSPSSIKDYGDHLEITNITSFENIRKLVYFSHGEFNNEFIKTNQSIYEHSETSQIKKQNTRYFVHGLHEYKGKFNPQIVKALYNIFNVSSKDTILDPFCGSGTSLVEASINNLKAIGTDINPLAVFIANTKIQSLNIPPQQIEDDKKKLILKAKSIKESIVLEENERTKYLKDWFEDAYIYDLESLRLSALELEENVQNLFLVIISNTLRDYSKQEPSDLRIRRRKSPYPDVKIFENISTEIDLYITKHRLYWDLKDSKDSKNIAYNYDIKDIPNDGIFDNNSFDFALTSPPYATALPYIDTQRLSLVWLGFISPKQIKEYECMLIGTREIGLKSERALWENHIRINKNNLPIEISNFCLELLNRLNDTDGFRKKAVPALLYKYFSEMRTMFEQVYRVLKTDKYFCLIVGHNQTTIGNVKTDINTPYYLSLLAISIGFSVSDIQDFETYQRYGIHYSNAINKESLIILKK